ncbi:glycoside hydrolase family 3 N-terminal domain-containing protein [uncultured Treponema sp.]|uniref:glycoside hydrolase family 3 protein n=1 Tax=uncultured Treponema sp. TaxID=162155 RepID=UPI0025D789E9|nr:glycoside hydrolase family 3 protein [uncultured Treponema sp.]
MTFAEKIRQSAEEGAVLLKNEDSVLPLRSSDSVAVFGRCQFDYYKSGTGSGGSVHVSYMTNLTDSLIELSKEDDQIPEIDVNLAEEYKKWIAKNPFDNGGGAWAGEPWTQKEMPLDSDLVEKSARKCNKAVYVIGRTAGEDKDNLVQKGSWFLTDEEHVALGKICACFENVCVVLNVSNIIDMEWIDEACFRNHIKSVLLVWHGGQEGGMASARLLCGKSNPCGKLTDTIARSIDFYPSTKTFGSKDNVYYIEDIYVGYRYFSTFAEEQVRYPFGFGLSYTSFSVEAKNASFENQIVTLKFNVKNTGKCAGKEVVQAYIEAPQGKLKKPARVLAAFKKTTLLECGESEEITLSFDLTDFASYDDSGVTGNEFSYVLEEGLYRIFAGRDVQSAERIEIDGNEGILLDSTVIVKKLSQAAAPELPFERIQPKIEENGKYSVCMEKVPLSKVNLAERIDSSIPEEIPFTGDRGIRFQDVLSGKSKMRDFIAQIEDEQLSAMVRGEGMMSQKVTVGIAAAYGGITQKLRDLGVPAAGCSDGPSGIRIDTGKETNLMPSGTLLACTWNPELVQELYEFEGRELVKFEIDSLLGPGVNIHRNPLNGRNFEYYSEDPLLSGIIATAVLKGLNKGGSSGTIKHFAANNQEFCRRDTNSVVSERALREIYLKPFEIAVKSGEVKSVMTSYNAINGHWAASNYDLVTTILRKEWGYEGLVMTDWWAGMNDCVLGGNASIKNTASMIRSGNDVYMVVDNDFADKGGHGDNIAESLKNGKLTRAELQQAAKHILDFISISPVAKRPLRPLKIFKNFTAKQIERPKNCVVIEEGEKILPEKTEFVYLHAAHEAMYNISGTYSKKGDDLSQSVTNIMIDGEPAASLECRSTGGAETTVNAAQVHLSPGYYKIELTPTKPGIETKSLVISSEVITPVTLGVCQM